MTSLRVILGESHVSYSAALEMCNLRTLKERRDQRMLTFALRCLKNDFTKDMFPKHEDQKKKEKFVVNFARTEALKNSAIIQCQHALNDFFKKHKKQYN